MSFPTHQSRVSRQARARSRRTDEVFRPCGKRVIPVADSEATTLQAPHFGGDKVPQTSVDEWSPRSSCLLDRDSWLSPSWFRMCSPRQGMSSDYLEFIYTSSRRDLRFSHVLGQQTPSKQRGGMSMARKPRLRHDQTERREGGKTVVRNSRGHVVRTSHDLPNKEAHRKYIRSDEWAQRRAEFFARYPRRCYGCGSFEEIHLHHRTYKRMGAEYDCDLVPLCSHCHHRVHAYHQKSGGSLWRITGRVTDMIRKETRTTWIYRPRGRASQPAVAV